MTMSNMEFSQSRLAFNHAHCSEARIAMDQYGIGHRPAFSPNPWR
jgi:hypothetical protein